MTTDREGIMKSFRSDEVWLSGKKLKSNDL